MASGELLFFGTAALCLPFLDELQKRFGIALVVTQPDACGGRCRKRIEPPVKGWAQARGLPLRQPETLGDGRLAAELASAPPALAVVIAYGQKIPAGLYLLPRCRTVNVHFSLLPRYRGAAPVQRAIENGETETGLTIFEIGERMDAGPVWAQLPVGIDPADTCASLQQRLAAVGAPFLADTVAGILAGQLRQAPQDERLATRAPAVRKQEGRIDWRMPAPRLVDRLRAFTPWPGLFFQAGGRQFRVLQAAVDPAPETAAGPGTVLAADCNGLRVACGGGTVLRIGEFQPESKRPMTPHDYCLGNQLPAVLP